ncbi:hypothetical protein CDAR_180211 [Caerostris darwini]|uniref:Uncharacterized protein n=1 Tax=Caerostris darwini TaxID=1538125 RepID=A0AAV4PE12_9ARAC|nr:hypothetical protein CDAR_180211 [Caerostris darwini]
MRSEILEPFGIYNKCVSVIGIDLKKPCFIPNRNSSNDARRKKTIKADKHPHFLSPSLSQRSSGRFKCRPTLGSSQNIAQWRPSKLHREFCLQRNLLSTCTCQTLCLLFTWHEIFRAILDLQDVGRICLARPNLPFRPLGAFYVLKARL